MLFSLLVSGEWKKYVVMFGVVATLLFILWRKQQRQSAASKGKVL